MEKEKANLEEGYWECLKKWEMDFLPPHYTTEDDFQPEDHMHFCPNRCVQVFSSNLVQKDKSLFMQKITYRTGKSRTFLGICKSCDLNEKITLRWAYEEGDAADFIGDRVRKRNSHQ